MDTRTLDDFTRPYWSPVPFNPGSKMTVKTGNKLSLMYIWEGIKSHTTSWMQCSYPASKNIHRIYYTIGLTKLRVQYTWYKDLTVLRVPHKWICVSSLFLLFLSLTQISNYMHMCVQYFSLYSSLSAISILNNYISIDKLLR